MTSTLTTDGNIHHNRNEDNMSNETNTTIDEIMGQALDYVGAYHRAWCDHGTDASMDKLDAAAATLRAKVAAALDSQARQIEALTAERDELRKRLDDAKPATPAPAPGEWVEWRGGECPIVDGTEHCVRLRSGAEYGPSMLPMSWEWSHCGSSGDIIAYRIIP